MTRRTVFSFAGALGLCCFTACGDGTGPTDGFVVSGTIQNNTASPIPSNARLLAVWVVSAASPDYTYVFGEGTIDGATGTFELVLSEPPPAQALNDGTLGVGILVVTTDQGVSSGDDIADVAEAELIGAAGSYGVIYVEDPSSASSFGSWPAEFEAGYGVGEGQDEPTGFDSFVPTDPTDVVIVIDAFANIEFVNWT
jgi:hypothetical protein